MATRGESHTNAGTPKINGKNVVSVSRDKRGNIQDFKLETGEIVGYEVALNSKIEGMLKQKGNAGQDILRSVPDGLDSNNLDNLPNHNE